MIFSDMTLVNKFQAYTRAEFNIWLGIVMTEDYIFCSIWSDQWQTRDEFWIGNSKLFLPGIQPLYDDEFVCKNIWLGRWAKATSSIRGIACQWRFDCNQFQFKWPSCRLFLVWNSRVTYIQYRWGRLKCHLKRHSYF